ncbi:MAG TPA: hypothetical protein VHF24_07370 [Acidimicrobiales bacterium]|nr:hypothetical protein [Acidimicrobiales bacterium]
MAQGNEDFESTDLSEPMPVVTAAAPPTAPPAPSPWLDRLAEHFVRTGSGPDGSCRLAQSKDAVLSTARQLADAGRWADVLRLVRVAEPAFAANAWWGAWKSALCLALDAARNLGDRRVEGWALHQLGVRSLGLEDESTARDLLEEALQAREEAGDREAAEVTRSQLDLIRG